MRVAGLSLISSPGTDSEGQAYVVGSVGCIHIHSRTKLWAVSAEQCAGDNGVHLSVGFF